MRAFRRNNNIAQNFALAAHAHKRPQNITVPDGVKTFVPFNFKTADAVIGCAHKVFVYKCRFYSFGIVKTAVSFNFYVFIVSGNNFRYIIAVRV